MRLTLPMGLLAWGCAASGGAVGDSPGSTGKDSATTRTDSATAVCGDVPASEPVECAAAGTGEYLALCVWEVFEDVHATGRFTAFGERGVEFTTDDGTVWDIGGGTSNVWASVPDLAAAGEVTLDVAGNCGGYGEGTTTALVSALDGSLLLLTGRGAGPWGVGGWTATTTDEGCGMREAPEGTCSACVSPRPVSVSGPATLKAWPGSADTADGYRLSVGVSYHGKDYVCNDGPGDDVSYWYVVRG